MINERNVFYPTFEDEEQLPVARVVKRHIYYPYFGSLVDGPTRMKDCASAIAEELELTYDEFKESKIYKRFGFATLDCEHAGYIERVAHGIHALTETGMEVFNVLEKFDKHNELHQTTDIIGRIDGRYPTVERGLDVLSELEMLADRILPKDSSEDRIKSLENKVELLTAELAEIKALLKK